jgi:hypothetical protein
MRTMIIEIHGNKSSEHVLYLNLERYDIYVGSSSLKIYISFFINKVILVENV